MSCSETKSDRRKRAAVIGAGVVGITTAKCCLDENIDVVIYERSDHSGGLWRFVAQDSNSTGEDGTATVMHSTIINSNKEVSAFSDFPPPADYPNFMHNSKMIEYIDQYMEQFGVKQFIRLKHQVMDVSQAQDHDQTGQWQVTVRNLQTQLEWTEMFDAVYICTGHHGHVSMPSIPDQELFQGKIVHSHDVKSGKSFEGQTVVVVGLGNSGADLASELANISKQVYVSIRSGTWVAHRVGPFGLPLDHFFLRRITAWLLTVLPYSLFCSIFEAFLNLRFDHSRYGLKPATRILSQHITVNDALPNLIISGKVLLRPRIKRFVSNGVIFEDDQIERVVQCDSVIFATGYKFKFPFISSSLLPVDRNRVPLYKYLFPPHLKHAHTLAVIGLIQPLGPIMPAAEMQARWCARLLVDACQPLPSEKDMMRDIEKTNNKMSKRFYESERHTVSFDWFPYMDELAKKIGVHPPLLRYLFTDPSLWFRLVFGCAANYQWRLIGPNAWSPARQTIMELNERIEAPFRTGHAVSNKFKKHCFKSHVCRVKVLLTLTLVLLSIANYLFQLDIFWSS